MDAKNKKSNGTSINDSLSELVVVLGNAGKCECGSLLDRWVELLQAVHKSIKSSRVDNSLSEVWGVLGNRSEHVCSGLLVEALK